MSNLNQKVKLQVLQSGAFTATKNRLDFLIPAGGVIDMTKSFINVNMSLDGDGNSIHVHDLDFTDNGQSKQLVDNVLLVKNIDVSSSKLGMIESIRRSDVLRSTLKQYEEDLSEKLSKSHVSLAGAKSKNKFSLSPFRILRTDGASQEIDHDVRLNLKDLLGCGSINALDMDKLGQTRISLECNFNKLVPAQNLSSTDIAWTNATDTDALGEMADMVAPLGVTLTENLTTSRTYEIEEFESQCPFYGGQEIKISSKKNGAAAVVSAPVKIATITHNTGNLAVYIVTEDPWISGLNIATDALTEIKVVGTDFTPTLRINSAEIVLSYNSSNQTPSSYQIVTYKEEEDQGNNRTTHNHQYQVEPEVMACIFSFPTSDSIVSDLAYNNYRIAVNNKMQTDRNIDRASPLFFDRVNRYFQNKGQTVGCLNERQLQKNFIPIKSQLDSVRYQVRNNAIMECMPITDSMKLLNLELNSSAGNEINSIILHKEMLKTF